MRRAVLVIFLLLAAAACQAVKPDPAAEKAGRALYDDLRSGRDESLLSRLPPRLRTAPQLAEFLRLRPLIPPGEPTSSKVVSTQVIESGAAGVSEVVAIEYDYPGRAVRLRVTVNRPQGGHDWQVTGVQVAGATDAALARNNFTLAGKPPMQLGFLAYAVLVPLLMLGSVAKVAATPGLRHKWVFVVLSFVGVCTLQMNWTTGVLWVGWYSFQIIGSGISHGPSRFDPWVISSNLPLGALLILGGLLASPRRPRVAA